MENSCELHVYIHKTNIAKEYCFGISNVPYRQHYEKSSNRTQFWFQQVALGQLVYKCAIVIDINPGHQHCDIDTD